MVLDFKVLSELAKKSDRSLRKDMSEFLVLGAPSRQYVDGKKIAFPPRSLRIFWHSQTSIESFKLTGWGRIQAGKKLSWRDNQVSLVKATKRSSVAFRISWELWLRYTVSKSNFCKRSTGCCLHNLCNVDHEIVLPHGYCVDKQEGMSWMPVVFTLYVAGWVTSAFLCSWTISLCSFSPRFRIMHSISSRSRSSIKNIPNLSITIFWCSVFNVDCTYDST